jgi:hypothetical protein
MAVDKPSSLSGATVTSCAATVFNVKAAPVWVKELVPNRKGVAICATAGKVAKTPTISSARVNTESARVEIVIEKKKG